MNYDVVVIGGGLAGVCAAIASARLGAKTALIQNRPVLGGNASSEIKMHICGADVHGTRPNARESGILEEILLEHKYRNPQNSFYVFDHIIWEKVYQESHLSLFLNLAITEVQMKQDRIIQVSGWQQGTEKKLNFKGVVFIDATGDGSIAAKAGNQFMLGSESIAAFAEPDAPQVADLNTMGSTLMFTAKDMGYPIPFKKPPWAYSYTEEQLAFRPHHEIDTGYWWIEVSGNEKISTISDNEKIRDELLKIVYGVWDHIKNGGEHGAKNYALDWIGNIPGKRESRRIIGQYILTEHDLLGKARFKDTIAYGGWPLDLHVEAGIDNTAPPTKYIHLEDIYTIPLRCLIARDCSNLLLAGRNISASKLAFSSTRTMGTCGIIGQAAGTAAALAKKTADLRECLKKPEEIDKIQQALLAAGAYLPGIKHRLFTPDKIIASSEAIGYNKALIFDGFHRNFGKEIHQWQSHPDDKQPSLRLIFTQEQVFRQISVSFDSDFSREIMPSLSAGVLSKQKSGVPDTIVKNFRIRGCLGEKIQFEQRIDQNYQRQVSVNTLGVPIDSLLLFDFETNGASTIKINEIEFKGAKK